MNNKQLIPTNEIKEEFEAILLEHASIAHCEINLKNGTIKNVQRLDTRYDEFALDIMNNEFCFSLKEKNSTTELETITRIQCTDESSRKKFSRYWFFIKPFSGIIRKEILKAVKAKSEKNS